MHVVTRVKICGLTRTEDADMAEALGADFLGVILAGGPRLLTLDRARAVLGPRRPRARRVAVFGDRSLESLIADGDALDLDVLQLHGDPSVELVRRLRERSNRAVWPVLRVDGTTLPASAVELADAAGALVLDAKVVGQLGGTGVSLDWDGLVDAVRALRVAVPAMQLVLAGGLRAANVGRAMALLEPDVVDVSSGVELAPGLKHPKAVEQFVSAVMAARRSSK